MTKNLDTRRIGIFLAFAFGITWATSLVIYLTGGLIDSPLIFEEVGVTLALLLMVGPVMLAPALANMLTRLVTGEGWQHARLRPRLKRTWRTWIIAWFGPGLLTIGGAVVFFLLFPRYYDPTLSMVQDMLETSAPSEFNLEETNLWLLVGAQILQAMLIAPVVNGLATFGEEFGWRAYLQPKLISLGPRRTMLIMGVIWGVWHWPFILMGHNYGADYPGAPFLGLLAMVWFCLTVGTFLGWVTIRSDSVWPAVIGHAALNGIASIGVIFMRGQPNLLLGPAPTGLIGGVGFTVVAAILLLNRRALEPALDLDQKS